MIVNTQIIDMDVLITEHIVKNEDDSYTIFLNARHSHEQQMLSYEHALRHIMNGDYEKTDADKIEFEAHSA